MSYIEAYYTRLREVVAFACPEVKANGIFETDHADMIPWEDMKPPYAVIAIGQMTGTDQWGTVVGIYETPVEVYYVAQVSGLLSPVRGALERLRDAFDAWDQDKVQVTMVAELEWGRGVPANQYFADKNMAHRAGRITVNTLIGAPLPVATGSLTI